MYIHISFFFNSGVFKWGTKGTTTCPEGSTLVTNVNKCLEEVPKWAKKPKSSAPMGCFKLDAIGCFANANYVAFSDCKHPEGTNPAHTPVCEQHYGKNRIFWKI